MSDNKSGKKGYKYHRLCVDGRRIDEHRFVMEKHLGRRLNSSEVVHHIDGDASNNDIDNLRLMNQSEHTKLHRKQGDLFTVTPGKGFSDGHIPYNRSVSEETALEMLSAVMGGDRVSVVARRFNVKRDVVSDIVHGRSYRSATGMSKK